MRHKQWPYYKEWCIIFGKDRATGDNGKTLTQALTKILNTDKGKSQLSTSSDNVPPPTSGVPNDCESEFMSACRGESASSPTKGPKKIPKKRPRTTSAVVEGNMVDMMSEFFAKTDAKLAQLVDKVGFDECEELRNKVYDILEDMVDLDVEQKLTVTSSICDKKKDLEIFCKGNEATRRVMVKMILEGRY